MDEIRASFAFLDDVGAGATPFVVPTELVPHTNVGLGYEILLPRFWGAGEPNGRFPGMQEFGSGIGFGTRAWPQLSISVGEADGTVAVCHGLTACETLTVSSLDQLEALLVSVPDDFADAVPPERAGDITLGGNPGRFERPGFHQDTGGGAFGLRGSPPATASAARACAISRSRSGTVAPS